MFEKPRPWWHGAYILRMGLGLLFLVSGAMKLADLPTFLQSVLAYDMLAGPAAGWLAVFLPVLEVLVGLLLVFGWLQAGSLAALVGLSVLFLFVHGYALKRGLDVDCGCFVHFSFSALTMICVNVVILLTTLWLLADYLRTNITDKPKYRLSRDLMRKRWR